MLVFTSDLKEKKEYNINARAHMHSHSTLALVFGGIHMKVVFSSESHICRSEQTLAVTLSQYRNIQGTPATYNTGSLAHL